MGKTLEEVIEKLKNGKVSVLPTDTIYGLVGSALSKKVVERIYRLKKRDPKKPMIILISSIDDLDLFEIEVTPQIKRILKKLWPGKVSIILPSLLKKFSYLHRGTKTLAFRLPQLKWLRNLLKETGPLVAPSANPEGLPPAVTVSQAREYFGENVDFYLDGGELSGSPSTLIQIKKGKIIIKRKGSGKIEDKI